MTVTASPDALSEPARRFLAGPHQLRIGSERVAARDGRTFETVDPEASQAVPSSPASAST